ncbi:hypothetical protein G7070_03780 [Propioniciclava coleopterorum]|uniref:Uncharacterized protein n=1 Tax=Propioniciclava coleopterorum TaxID=2714937 RepID=A0A6G7Y410_9ACTN|nr:hypothetical protein [Propioniciclava coleopterorum]QIK71552.1 hypothetical protein G7070_03780 [Propioniciclava coleopterorum]
MIVPPAWGIPVILVVGIAVVFFGWWWDRRATRIALEGYTPQPEVDAERADDPDAAALLSRLEDAVTVPTAANPAFLTLKPGPDGPAGPLAAVHRPLVLLADAALSDPVALVPALRHARAEQRPLVLVATELDARVLETLDANARTGRVTTLALTATPEALARLSELTAATPLTAQDWTAGWLPANAWGTVDGWVADATRSWLLLPA